jgi:hypothetical protein
VESTKLAASAISGLGALLLPAVDITELAAYGTDIEHLVRALRQFLPLNRVNRDDEDKFQAHLNPSIGKRGFDVDFSGRGFSSLRHTSMNGQICTRMIFTQSRMPTRRW